MLDRFGRSYFFVVGFALFPPLAMLANNLEGTEVGTVLRPLVLSVLLALAVFGLLRVITGDTPKASLLTIVLIAAAFSYGHVYSALKDSGLVDLRLIRHRFLLPLVLIVSILAFWWLIRRSSSWLAFPPLNLVALVLIAMPIYQITAFSIESAVAERAFDPSRECQISLKEGSVPPDIYHFVLDAYERDDVLREMHGYDNSPFLNSLENKGFYVAYGSLSNYRHTEMTLASMLNMDYLQSIPGSYSEDSKNRQGVIPRISKNEVRHQLECVGYKTVTFETGPYWTEWPDADYFITSESSILDSLHATGRMSRFEALIIETTIARAFFDLATQAGLTPAIVAETPLAEHRDRILFVFDQLERASDLPSPKFVYVHILSPHPPFVFGPGGEQVSFGRFETDPDLNEKDQLTLYADQVTYLNTRMLEVIEGILEDSTTPPLIIVHGDHGWADRNAEDKLSILNAFYLPNGGADLLYPTITPVNTYRTIFDYYFDSQLGLLEDLSYFSNNDRPFEFELVENSWSSE